MEIAVIGLLIGVPLLYTYTQVLLLRRWAGGWRIAAMLPLAAVLLWATNFAREVTADPTSHNLFPFEVLIGAGVALLYLGCLAAARCAALSALPR